MMRIFAESHPLPSPLLPRGLVGVSPSPSNCSSPDNTSSVCTVNEICTSLTPCVAKHHAELNRTIWKQVLPGEEYILSCFNKEYTSLGLGYSLTRSRNGYSLTGDWGRCLHVESVEKNTFLKYVIKEVFPLKAYTSKGMVSHLVLFIVEGELPVYMLFGLYSF